jgi:hypothetical protein
VYLSCTSTGSIHRYDTTFTDPPELFSGNHEWPAGTAYNHRDQLLAVPYFEGDTMVTVDLSPRIRIAEYELVETTGDGDGHLDPGESAELWFTIHNYRHSTSDVTGELTSTDSNIVISSNAATFGPHLGWGEELTVQSPHEISVDPSCPDPSVIDLVLTVEFDGGSRMDTVSLFVGDSPGLQMDFEARNEDWRHSWVHPAYHDQWHLEWYRSHSGDFSIKCGGSGPEAYGNLTDGGLISPPFLLPENGVLTFWHYIDAESYIGNTAWDGGTVWIRTDGDRWQQLEPDSGYPRVFAENFHCPLPSGTGCFSGTQDWSVVTADLSGYSGAAELMFRFSSDVNTAQEGWYLDDIDVSPPGCCQVAADVDYNGVGPDIADLVFLVDYMFAGGEAPPCWEASDIDGNDAGPDIADLVYLVDYMFAGGPAPPPCL